MMKPNYTFCFFAPIFWQTSKDMGVNVESDLESALILHTFALSKDENKS